MGSQSLQTRRDAKILNDLILLNQLGRATLAKTRVWQSNGWKDVHVPHDASQDISDDLRYSFAWAEESVIESTDNMMVSTPLMRRLHSEVDKEIERMLDERLSYENSVTAMTPPEGSQSTA
mmetsp:Transcript_178530/g.572157  ORF Transcript_178530/g.572157 Transcript_178530/m.572157 type:complete len:121 (+) Transcript_178530:206-568(+)